MLTQYFLSLVLVIFSSLAWAQPNDDLWYPAKPEWLVKDINTSDGTFVLHWEMMDEQEVDYFK